VNKQQSDIGPSSHAQFPQLYIVNKRFNLSKRNHWVCKVGVNFRPEEKSTESDEDACLSDNELPSPLPLTEYLPLQQILS
jgi:hypothetical protein